MYGIYFKTIDNLIAGLSEFESNELYKSYIDLHTVHDCNSSKKGIWNTTDWFNTSSNRNLSIRDIAKRCIINNVYKVDSICMTYVCEYKQLTLDEIKEFSFLSSPLFSFDYYNEDTIDFVAYFYSLSYEHRQEIFDKLCQNKPIDYNMKKIDDRLIHKMMTFDKVVSMDNALSIELLIKYQNCSKQIIKFYRDLITSLDNKEIKNLIDQINYYGCSTFCPYFIKNRKKFSKKIEHVQEKYNQNSRIKEV